MTVLGIRIALFGLFFIGMATNIFAQSLTWYTPITETEQIGGLTQRESPAAAVYNGLMYGAYTSTAPSGYYNNHVIYVASSSYLSFLSWSAVNAYSNANPSLLAFKGLLYLAYNYQVDAIGDNRAGIVTYDGTSWSNVTTGLPAGNVDNSPSLATDGTYLYVGLRDQGSHTFTLCKTDGVNPFTCQNFPSTMTMNFNPGLAVFNGVLYAGFETYANSHNIYYYTLTNYGTTISAVNTSLSGSQSSCAPHLAVHNGVLWFDVRTNDSAHKFSQRYTTNGTSWSNGADAHIAMEGEPTIVDGAGMTQNSQYFYLFYGSNASPTTLYAVSAQ